MIIYNRDKEGKIDKSSTTYIQSMDVVNNQVKELIEGTELATKINDMNTKVDTNSQDILKGMDATAQLFEMVVEQQAEPSTIK